MSDKYLAQERAISNLAAKLRESKQDVAALLAACEAALASLREVFLGSDYDTADEFEVEKLLAVQNCRAASKQAKGET